MISYDTDQWSWIKSDIIFIFKYSLKTLSNIPLYFCILIFVF